jgi:hypothetical protein
VDVMMTCHMKILEQDPRGTGYIPNRSVEGGPVGS